MKNRMSLRRLAISILLTAMTLINVACYKAGTLGGGDLNKFDCTREALQNCLDSLIFKNPSLTLPVKWIQYNNWEETGYEFLHGVTIYFPREDDKDERMYYLTLVAQGDRDTLWTKPSYLSVRSIFMKNDKGVFWKTMREVDKKERELAELRIAILTSKFGKMCGCNRLEVISKVD
ncbi:MAG TPA: hypothetical protein VGQ59_19115 [Cyclobacteriaceae bacterium]|jgi:hypothetical protein|nr:hypothetical protein [Cyclobacteriaceae bacterium]